MKIWESDRVRSSYHDKLGITQDLNLNIIQYLFRAQITETLALVVGIQRAEHREFN
jgi:uncharacterized SAM-dependent methyltransferase